MEWHHQVALGSGVGPRAPARSRALIGGIVLALGVIAASPRAVPQAKAEKPIGTARFVGRYWSQAVPALNFQYGCDTGWHAFSFRARGYFLYDGKVSGHWWLDQASNVGVLTNEGERLTLLFDGSSNLQQLRRDEQAQSSPFGQEYRVYRECAVGGAEP